jgi:hypothetical protein
MLRWTIAMSWALVIGCRPPRPDPNVNTSVPCAIGQMAVCFGACAATAALGERCTVDECSAPPVTVCAQGLACIPAAAGTTGACEQANGLCNPNAPNGAADNRCEGTMVCRRFGTAEQVAAGAACGVNLRDVFRWPDGTPARGLCVLPRRDGDACTSDWTDARSASGTAGAGPHCSPCAPGLDCLGGTCRRPCPGGRNDCPANQRGNVEQSFDYACSNVAGARLCTTCAPLGALCASTTLNDAPTGRCCTPDATCQRTCCMPQGETCNQSSDCCAGSRCSGGRCNECGVLGGVCCDDLGDPIAHPRCRVADGQHCGASNTCEVCGHATEPSCAGRCTGRTTVAGDRCVVCGTAGAPTCTASAPCDGTLVVWNGTCRVCGGQGAPPCADGTCLPGAHLDWNSAERANLCDTRCGQPMTGASPFPSRACAVRYAVDDTFQYRFHCYGYTQLFADQFADRAHCLCVPTMATPPTETDVSDNSGTCVSTNPNPGERPGPPDQ